MAKITGPLMSIDASGAFADTMVYAKWKGIKYSRQYCQRRLEFYPSVPV